LLHPLGAGVEFSTHVRATCLGKTASLRQNACARKPHESGVFLRKSHNMVDAETALQRAVSMLDFGICVSIMADTLAAQ